MTKPTFDFETYSEAGCVWSAARNRWEPPKGAKKRGISAVATRVYCEHPSAEVLSLSYDLRDGRGMRRWRPGQPNPQDLFDHVAAGRPLECHKAMFERSVWELICVLKYGWPPLNPYVLRCSMATARVNSLPGALGDLSAVLKLPVPKDADGKRLLELFSLPRNPTKKDPRLRVLPSEEPAEAEKLYGYNDTDVIAEQGASDDPRMQPMSDDELLFWMVDQEINWRGVGVDRPALRDCEAVLAQALEQYGDECRKITGFNPNQLAEIRGWLSSRGVHLPDMKAETIEDRLAMEPHAAYWRIEETPEGRLEVEVPASQGVPMPPDALRVLQIRTRIGSASVKKLYAMENQAGADDRLHDLIAHHGARTGRPTGEGPQPLNLPRAGPDLAWCPDLACARPFKPGHAVCPWCAGTTQGARKGKWSAGAVDHVLAIMATRSLSAVEFYFGDALLCISGCLRGLFVAGPGRQLIASDYSSIEAVVIAELSGEQWRIDAFKERKPMYLLSASKVTGRSLEEYERYYEEHGDHHPDRQKIGKINELANGFSGWIGSSKAFGSTDPDEVIKANILAWRAASPAIPEMWGGQFRSLPWEKVQRPERFGVEGMAVNAIEAPGLVFDYRGLKFFMRGDALIIRLLSGRELTYHEPRLTPRGGKWPRLGEYAITYMTWNTNPKYGPRGWVPMNTYGGRLTENIVQATAHDILRHAILLLRAAGYPCVLHVYDEIVCEIPLGTGSLEEFERIMSTMPWWAAGWPIIATGGWISRRYRKG